MVMGNLQPAGGSSFGVGNTTWGPGGSLHGRSFLDSERFRELDRRQSYYDGAQHDYKRFDWDGRVVSTGGSGIQMTQPLLSAEKAAFYVPLRSRRPSSPYRLPKVIVNAFTNLVFGENRFPRIKCEGDDGTEDYAQTLIREMGLPTKMIQARNRGGCCGTSVMSWGYVKGRPVARVHNAKYCIVHKWDDRDALIPAHVSEVYQFPKDEWNEAKKRNERNYYWHRRDWTTNEDIAFHSVLVEPGKDPEWQPNLEKSVIHKDGLAHVVWIQNRPCEDIDGEPDYEGLYENFDTLDITLSVIVRGAVLNLDPTLVLKIDPLLAQLSGIKKGSDNALMVGEAGDANYMELAGTSITAGIELFNTERKSVLEVAQCVLPDPDEVAAGATSSVALKVVYAPMTGAADLLREQYACGITRLLEPMIIVARAAKSRVYTRINPDTKEEESFKQVPQLPPKYTKEPALDDEGTPTGDFNVKKEDRDPGDGEELEAEWPPYFPPTPADQSQIVTTLSAATGQQAFMSTQTATEIVMQAFGKSGQEEAVRVQQQQKQMEDKQAEMLDGADASGKDDSNVTTEHTAEMPDGSTVKKTKEPKPPPPPKPIIAPGMGGKPSPFGAKGAPPGGNKPGKGGPAGPGAGNRSL